MQEAKHPTTTKHLPPQSQSPSPSVPAAASPPLYHPHHGYGTFPRPFQPTPPPPPVVGAAACGDYRHASPSPIGGFGGQQGFVAFPSAAVQQQVFVESVGVPVREPPLPFCGVGIGWFLFLLGFFLAAIPWYAGAFLLFFVALDHREKPGLIACTVAGIFALVPFILNGIRLNPLW